MKYVKKPVVVEAFQFGIDESPEWFMDAYGIKVVFDREPNSCAILTLEGIMEAREGDMIIKGIQGEIYPCKRDIFDATYDIYEEQEE